VSTVVALVCRSAVQRRLGISAGRDNRKILMASAHGHQQAEGAFSI